MPRLRSPASIVVRRVITLIMRLDRQYTIFCLHDIRIEAKVRKLNVYIIAIAYVTRSEKRDLRGKKSILGLWLILQVLELIFLGVQSKMLYLHYFIRYKLLKKSLPTRADRQLETSNFFLLPPLPPLVAANPARSSILRRINVLVATCCVVTSV